MIRYYKLFDLLNRTGRKKTDLRNILSSRTIAKLSKGEYISGEVIDKICLFLECQPSDIMEVFKEIEIPQADGTTKKAKYKLELQDEMEMWKEQQEDERRKQYMELRRKMEENEQ